MSIQFLCMHCNKSIVVKHEFAGKRGKCPGCKQVVLIPNGNGDTPKPIKKPTKPSPNPIPAADSGSALDDDEDASVHDSPQPTSRSAGMSGIQKQGSSTDSDEFRNLTKEQLQERIIGSFQGNLEPLKISLITRFGLLLTALFCLLMAAIPWLTVIAIAAGVGWWSLTGGSQLWLVAMIAGVMLALFLRRLLVPTQSTSNTIVLTRQNDPLLWDLIDRLAIAIQVPPPYQVQIDCSLQAKVHGPGVLSNRVTLLFGLPLAGTLTITQFVGVLARELGRCRRGSGQCCKGTMRWAHQWLASRAYQPDAFDRWLGKQSKAMKLFCIPLQAGDWLVRGYLKIIFFIVHLAAGNHLRQLEFSADHCQASLVGSQGFFNTVGKLRLLEYAWKRVQADILYQLSEKQLPENFVAAIITSLRETPAEVREIIMEQAAAVELPSYDPSPSEKERLEAVRKLAAGGIFQCKSPAVNLFADFAKTAKLITWEYYRAKHGKKVRQHELRRSSFV